MTTISVPDNPPFAGDVPVRGQPAWNLALLYPLQGQWEDLDYLEFTNSTNRLVELSDGSIEVLPIPTSSHQRMVLYLLAQLQAFVLPGKLGEVLCAPLRVKIRAGRFREPDLVFMLAENHSRVGEDFWNGADLVIEVVSDDDNSRLRDLQHKPLDYAEGGIPEYWIVDPKQQRITVLMLQDQAYQTFGTFSITELACSRLLTGFRVNVSAVFQAAQG